MCIPQARREPVTPAGNRFADLLFQSPPSAYPQLSYAMTTTSTYMYHDTDYSTPNTHDISL